MSASTTRRRPRGDDSGSALVLALIVVLVVGTLLAVALEYTGTGLTIAPVARDDRNEANYVSGAVEGAINHVRDSSELGKTDVACPDFVPPVPAGISGVSGKVVKVTCSGVSTGSSADDDQPRYAIQTLGTGTRGIRQVAGNDELYIDGGIYSNGVITVGGGSGNSMRVNGTATATGSCSSNLTTTDPRGPLCSPPAQPLSTDPDYLSSIPDAAALTTLIDTGVLTTGADPVPTCASDRITFQPGYYGTAPDVLVDTVFPGGCNKTLWHFSPGRYYFDYPGLWDLDDHKVVAGTLSGTPTDLGRACNATASGAQFVFGGTSQVFTRSSSGGPNEGGLEVCGPAAGHTFNGGPQRIALYGLKSGAASSATTRTLTAASAPVSTPSNAFLVPALAQTIDAGSDTTTLNRNTSATLDYGVLTTTPSIPKGSSISNVTLHVNHGVVAPGGDGIVRIKTPGMATATPITVGGSCLTTCSVDITNQLSSDVPWRMLSELNVSLEVSTSGGPPVAVRTATVNGLELVVTYRAPALTAQSCTGSCTVFFESSNNPNVFFHGTVYTPTADWAVNVHNGGETIFDRGIILRDLAVTMSASSKQDSSPFRLPSATPDGRLVLFRGYLDGVEKVRACARYVDTVSLGTVNAAYAGWSLTIPRWHVMRTPSAQTPSCP